MTISVDKNIYPDSCISKTVYDMSDHFSFIRTCAKGIETITVIEKSNRSFDEATFWDKLNDYKLRGQILTETKDIRTILYAKAFGELDDLADEDNE